MYQQFLALSIFLQFLKMASNFGVFLDFAHPFLTEADFTIMLKSGIDEIESNINVFYGYERYGESQFPFINP